MTTDPPSSALGHRRADRVDQCDWATIARSLDEVGVASTGPLLGQAECHDLIDSFDDPDRYRATIDMARHRFGEGQYRYFDRPLPPAVAELRAAFWPHLLPVARAWAQRRDEPSPWPDDFDEWLHRGHEAGQTRPTPLILRYGTGGWNALHRDL
jgi:uncharacterized protein